MKRRAFLAALLPLLASCGGGSGSGDGNAQASNAPFTVAFYGDSITTGTHSAASATGEWKPASWSPTPVEHVVSLTGIRAYDYSFDGASSADVTIKKDDSHLVVIRFGVADSVRNMAPELFWAHTTRLVNEARALNKQVLITGLPHAVSVDTRPFDKLLHERSNALGVPFVEIYTLPFSAPSDLADPLHPSEAYSRRITANLAEAVLKMTK